MKTKTNNLSFVRQLEAIRSSLPETFGYREIAALLPKADPRRVRNNMYYRAKLGRLVTVQPGHGPNPALYRFPSNGAAATSQALAKPQRRAPELVIEAEDRRIYTPRFCPHCGHSIEMFTMAYNVSLRRHEKGNNHAP